MRIPDHDESLYIGDQTTVPEVMDYVAERLCTPARPEDGVVVWNFHNRSLDAQALLNADLNDGLYVVPYQVPGVWGFMVDVLPGKVSDATLLTYAAEEQSYSAYENFRSLSLGTRQYRDSLEDEVEDCLDPQTKEVVFGGGDGA